MRESADSPTLFLHPANLLTYAGLAAALLVVGLALRVGDWQLAGAGLAMAALADLADGRFASLFDRTRPEKAFGAQLDSLADAVSFGALPVAAVLILSSPTGAWQLLLPMGATIYLLAAVTRLAAFNVVEDGSRFVGIPTTVAGLICSTLFWFEPAAPPAAACLLATAALMVAPLVIPRPGTVLLMLVGAWGSGLIWVHLVTR